MATCTFFGHRDCPGDMASELRAVLVDLITSQGVEMFYVGNQGQFDALVCRVLGDLKRDHPQVNCAVVLAYLPGKKNDGQEDSNTMVPEGIECVHPRHAISRRNDWMLRKSDFVVTYITHSWGGAAQYARKALRSGRTVINLAKEGQA